VNEKQVAGEKAAEFIRNGMTVGLGSGSTVYYSIRRIAELVSEVLLRYHWYANFIKSYKL